MVTLAPGDNPREALRQVFGFAEFRPGQREAVEAALAGRDALVVMPTGNGKSVCYQLPAAMREGLTLVVSPLISLMKDQVDALVAAERVPATYVNSALPPEEQRARLAGAAAGRYKLLYLAPERLRNPDFVEAMRGVRVALLAVDEAHCVSEWGHDFRPDFLHIPRAAAALGGPPLLALTATATPAVRRDVAAQLRLREPAVVLAGFDRPNLYLAATRVLHDEARWRAVTTALRAAQGSAIVYVGTRAQAEEVADRVASELGIPVAAYHGGQVMEVRKRVQERFMAGEVRVVAATNAFGMGIDKPDVRAVIHYMLPGSVEAYYQEAGRAGRDGAPASCTLVWSERDLSLHEWFITRSLPTGVDLRQVLATVFRAGQGRVVRFALGELRARTGLGPAKLKVALHLLEGAGLLRQFPARGEALALAASAELPSTDQARAMLERCEAQRRRRESQSHDVLSYAEDLHCRRRRILRYFGDPATPQPGGHCCDACARMARGPARPARV